MDLLTSFKNYLFSQEVQPSRVTVKNYLSDINHFVNWFSQKYNSNFTPGQVNFQTLEEYKKDNSSVFSASSMQRHLSSLRKFFKFLKMENQITFDPFEALALNKPEEKDYWKLKDFKSSLFDTNAAHLTIKNYIIDVKQFISWAKEATGLEDSILPGRISKEFIEEYKAALSSSKGFSPASVNRKLSSLRKYLTWADEAGILTEKVLDFTNINEAKQKLFIPEAPGFSQPEIKAKTYSRFPPLRLAQKLSQGLILVVDTALILPLASFAKKGQDLAWTLKGKPIFHKNPQTFQIKNITHKDLLGIRNISKKVFAPSTIAVSSLSPLQRIIFHARFTRPNWYKKYHSYAITHYFHFAVFIIVIVAISLGFYNSFFGNQSKITAANLPTSPNRILSFQGRLTDNNDNPITSLTNLRFAIYTQQTPGTGAGILLWQEVDKVTPDQDGIFNTLLGSGPACANPIAIATGQCAIPSTLFAENAALFLGVTVESTGELTPRQQIATVGYAANSETLQGLLPITATAAGTSNVVLALDSSGNLTIGGSASPAFSASGGQFKLSGQPLLLTTNDSSNSNVVISPNGTGKIDVQKPLQNNTLSTNIRSAGGAFTAAGAVEVNDQFAILATSSGQSAFTVNQNSTGPVISASVSGSPVFTVDNGGNISNSGNYSVSGTGGITLLGSGAGITFSGSGNHDITASSGTLRLGSTTLNGTLTTSFTGNNRVLYADSATGALSAVGAAGTGQCLLSGASTPSWGACTSGIPTIWWTTSADGKALTPINSTMDILIGGTTTASAKFSFTGLSDLNNRTKASISGQLIVMPNNGFGNVGIGTTTPNGALTVASGQILVAGGTKTAPDIGLTGSTNTGFYFGSSSGGYAAFTSAGTPKFFFQNLAQRGFVLSNNVSISWVSTSDATSVAPDVFLSRSAAGVLRVSSDESTGEGDLIVNGNLSVGTSSPISQLHVTRPLTYAATGKALAVFDQIENQDIFTASASGTPIFTITRTGGISLGSNGLNYGTGSQCISGGATASWVNCALGTNWWTTSADGKALTPINTTMDLLVGGNSTSSAQFAVLNIAGTLTPVASVSATAGSDATKGIYISGNGSLQAVRNNTLTIGGSTTGNILLSPLNNSGYVGIGTTTPISLLSAFRDIADVANIGRSTAQNIGIGGTSGGNFLTSYSATNNAKSLIINATTDSSNTAPSAGTNGIVFQIRGGTAFAIDDNADSRFYNNVTIDNTLTVSSTASIAGNLTLSGGARSIQTTTNNNLTIGGNTTGNIWLMPRNGAGTVYGDTAANGDLTLEGTSNATKTSSYILLQPNGGNVGIGDTTPSQLFVVGNGDLFQVNSTGDFKGTTLALGNGTLARTDRLFDINNTSSDINTGTYTGTIQKTITGTISANRTDYGLYNYVTTTASDDMFSHTVIAGYNVSQLNNGYTIDTSYATQGYSLINSSTLSTNGNTASTSAGVYGIANLNAAGAVTSNIGVYGIGQNSNAGGTVTNNDGGRFISYATADGATITTSRGVYAQSYENGDYASNGIVTGYGGYFDSQDATTAYGIWARALQASGLSETFTNAYGIHSTCQAGSAGTTITNCYGITSLISASNATATITNAYSLHVQNPTSTGNIVNNYGLLIADQTGGDTADYGLAIAGADTQVLWLSSGADNTDAANGIAFGSSRDTNLYRSAADTLKTDDRLAVGTLNSGGSNILCYDGSNILSSCAISYAIGPNWWTTSADGKALTPINNTMDLLIGGNSTSSAQFAVLNIAGSLTPVASVSATAGSNATKGIYLSGDGSLQAVRNNTLTIGGSTTGNINLSPSNGSGFVNISGGLGASAIIAGKNILPYQYASWETGVDGTNIPSSRNGNVTSVTVSTAGAYDGTRSVAVTTNGSATDGFVYLNGTSTTSYNIPIKPSTKYAFSVYSKLSAGTTCSVEMYVKESDGTHRSASGTADTSSWTRLSSTFTSNSGSTAVILRVDVNCASTTALFDGFMLEEIPTSQTYASAWSSDGNFGLRMDQNNLLGLDGSASVSGSLILEGASRSIQSYNQETLTIGGNTTGNITLSPNNGTGGLINNNGYIAANGNTTITGAPLTAGTNLGWKIGLWSNTYALGVANSTVALKTGTWLSLFGSSNPANNATTTTPDTNSNISFNATTGDASAAGSLVFTGSNKSIDILNGSRLDFQTSPGGDAGLANAMTILSNGNVGIGTTAPISKFTIGNNITNDASYDYSEAQQTIFDPNDNGGDTPNGTRDILSLVREGVSAQSYGNKATFALGRYEDVTTNSRSQLDIKLTDGSFNSHNTILSLQSAGNVGIGDTSPDTKLEVLSTTEQLRLTYTDNTVDSRFTVDSSGNLTIDNTGTKTVVADDFQVTGNDILDSGAATRITLGATTTLTNTGLTLSGTTALTASSLSSIDAAASLTIDSTTLTLGGGSAATIATTTNGLTLDSGSNTLTFAATDTTLTTSLTSMTTGAAFTINGTSYVRVGDTATPGTATGDDDLFVEGDLEVDGVLYTDGGIDTALTPGSVVFAGTSGVLSQDNASLFYDDTNDSLGLGTAVPGSATRLSVAKTWGSATAGEQFGIYSNINYSTADTGLKQNLRLSTSATHTTGTQANLIGLLSLASGSGNGGNTTNAYGLWTRIDSATGHTVTNGINYGINNGSVTGTLTNQMGIQIGALTTGTNNAGILIGEATGTNQSNLVIGSTTIPTGTFSIYNSSTDINYFAGDLGLGVSDPASNLQIVNNVATGGLDNFSEYQVLLYDSGTANTSYGLGVRGNTQIYQSGGTTHAFDIQGTEVASLTTSALTLSGQTSLTASSLTTMTTGAAFTLNGTSYVRVGDTATPGTATGDDDLFVEGDIELDGILYADSTVTIAGTGTALTLSGAATTAINISNTGVTTDLNLQNGETIDNNTDGVIKLTGMGYITNDFGIASSSAIPAPYNNLNVLPNPSFEVQTGSTLIDGWTSGGTGTVTRVSNGSANHDGAYGIALSAAAATSTNIISQRQPVSPSTNYTISVWAKVDTACGDGFYLRAFWNDEWGNGAGQSDAYGNSGAVTTSWVLYQGQVTSPANAYNVRAQIYNHLPNNTCTLYVDQVSLRPTIDGNLALGGDLTVSGSIFGTLDTTFTQGSVVFAGPSGVIAEDNTNFFFNDTTNRLGIGNNSPNSDLEISNANNPTIRLSEASSTTSYLSISDNSSTQAIISKTAASGTPLLDLDVIASDGTSPAYIRINRNSNTSGSSGIQVYKGDGTATLNSFVAGNGSSYFNVDNGNLGVGDTSADAKLEVLSTTEQLRLTYTDNTVDSRFTVDSSGNLTIDNTGTKTVVADDFQVTGNDILDSGAATRITLGATTTLTNTGLTLSGTTALTASSLSSIDAAASLTIDSTTLTLGSNATINGGSAANDDITIQGTSNATRTSSYVFLQPTAGSVGIGSFGSFFPRATLDVAGSASVSGDLTFLGTSLLKTLNAGDFTFQTSPGGDAGLVNRMVIKNLSGNVGIGTTGPDTALEINSATGNNLRLTYNDNNGSATNYADLVTNSGGDLTINPTGGDISITSDRINFNSTGVAAPTFTNFSAGVKIVLYNDLSGSAAGYTLGIESGTMFSTVSTTAQQFKWYGGTTTAMTLSGAGALTLVGDIAVNGDDITTDGSLTITPTTTLTLNSTGDMTLDSSGDIILDADGADVFLKDNGTTFGTFTNGTTNTTFVPLSDGLYVNGNLSAGIAPSTNYRTYFYNQGTDATSKSTTRTLLQNICTSVACSGSYLALDATAENHANSTQNTTGTLAAIGGTINNADTGTVSTARALQLSLSGNSGTITNTYGLYIGDMTTGTQTNTPYSVYASDASTYNYFAGWVGIGNTAPAAPISIKQVGAGGVTLINGYDTTTGTNQAFTLNTDANGNGSLDLYITGTRKVHLVAWGGDNSYILDSNFGLGTSAPTAKLDIAGSASTSGNLAFNGSTLPAGNNIYALNAKNLNFIRSASGPEGTGEIGDDWSTQGQGQLPGSRMWHTTNQATINGTTYIYTIGGTTGTTNNNSTVYKATVDSSGNVGAFSTSSQGQLPATTSGHSSNVVTINGTNYIYVIGGGTTSGGFPDATGGRSTVYKATIDSSGNVGAFSTTSQGQLPQARTGGASTTVTIGGTNYIYVLGGDKTAATFQTSTVYKATIDSSGNVGAFSTTSQAQLPAIMDSHQALSATVNGTNYIYVLGGETGGGTTSVSTVYKATVDTSGNVGAFSTSSQGQLPNILRYHSAITNTDSSGTTYVYVSGGYDSAYVGTNFVAAVGTSGNLSNFTSTSVFPNTNGSNSLNTATLNGTSYIYSIGGYFNGAATTKVFRAGIFNSSLSLAANGNIGIGTSNPITTFQIRYNQNDVSLTNPGVMVIGNLDGANVGFDNNELQARNDGAAAKLWLNNGGGEVGVGAGGFDVEGNIQMDIQNVSGTFAYCHGTNGAAGDQNLNDCNGSATDIAEYYPGTEDMEPGDLVTLVASSDARFKYQVIKPTTPYDQNLIGVVSTIPTGPNGDVLGDSTIPEDHYPQAIGLAGRVVVKVSLENGPIQTNDYLTSSSTPGVAMKATKSSRVIGRAIEDYDGTVQVSSGSRDQERYRIETGIVANKTPVDPPTGIGKILMYTGPTLFDPDVFLTSAGNLNLVDNSEYLSFDVPHTFILNDPFNLPITRIGAFAELISAKITAGFIKAEQISTKSLNIATANVSIAGQSLHDYIASIVSEQLTNISNLTSNNLVSPIAQIDEIHTNVISPVGQTKKVAIKLNDNQGESKLEIQNASGSALASFDSLGNASISGNLSSNNLLVDSNATVSGVLRASKIIADEIEGLNIKTSTIAANYITNNYYVATPGAFPTLPANSSNNSAYQIAGDYINIASYSSQLARISNLTGDDAIFNNTLTVFGQTTLTDTSIIGQLAVGGNLIIADEAINVLGGDLNLQPLRQGGLSIMAGLIHIDTNGNATFENNATIKGTLYANQIAPLPGKDLNIKLASSSADTNSLVVKGASGAGVLAINNLGDLIASGEASFAKLNINNIVGAAYAISPTEVVASGSAGTVTLKAFKTEVTVNNKLVTPNSLIYITPLGSTASENIYLMRQVPGKSFTVGISNPISQDIKFNFLIVN